MPKRALEAFSAAIFGIGLILAAPAHAYAQPAPPALSADPAIVKLVPAEIRKAGTLAVGTDATYPPFESISPTTHQIVGFDADMAKGLASLMGLKLDLVNTPFDNLIPSISSGKFNLALSSMGDTKPREAVVDFVTYYWNSTNLLVPGENPKHLSMDNVCGARIGVERGALQQTTTLPMLMRKCPDQDPALAAGSVFRSSTDAVLALTSNRIRRRPQRRGGERLCGEGLRRPPGCGRSAAPQHESRRGRDPQRLRLAAGCPRGGEKAHGGRRLCGGTCKVELEADRDQRPGHRLRQSLNATRPIRAIVCEVPSALS